ncbi:hypothetical protein KTD33_08340 [Burkholderia gladioli]|uniref:DUF6708 domain-containing protein n=1 Tax=Burkholderia gladioli TaxID=28095 RepID=A0A2A7S0J0_BURGA|nr:DUF6708 domain-containing protein [Burkholderia gladioli]MBU9194546.1 hypothetical protein [Burkholderia gladioli]MBU9422988.1 hypothetical protein [Burkholderia gladioli]MDN8064550.1 hypothetical protein [Burkholderia gladioli]PEH36825.1 hypothetical protein CRM94_19685 [Burkholderia gladioli]QPQ83211.1 hypothetical protein I6H08_18410 [Burkholderia gladioli]
MDERVMKKCIGEPVPKWDLAHRLPINQSVGPTVQDFGSTFSINSTFMDVIEPSFLEKQWFVTGVVFAFLCIGIGPYIYVFTHANGASGDFIMNCLAVGTMALFGTMVWKLGRGLFFGLRYRPIRFHREARKLFAMRTRRFFGKSGEGDVVWEAPWTEDSIFCLHREDTSFGTIFHIRHYTVDDHGNVTRVFSIGREWTGRRQVEMALAQWNYWCAYMNDGPSGLPKPMLFHTQNETPRESFLFSLYSFGMRAPVFIRLLMMPLILIFTVMRIIANATCRDPVWPAAIEQISVIAPDDLYAEPRSGTPVGWGDTVLAQQRGEYPNDPKARVEDWAGEPDGRLYAAAWLENPGANMRHAAARS